MITPKTKIGRPLGAEDSYPRAPRNRSRRTYTMKELRYLKMRYPEAFELLLKKG